MPIYSTASLENTRRSAAASLTEGVASAMQLGRVVIGNDVEVGANGFALRTESLSSLMVGGVFFVLTHELAFLALIPVPLILYGAFWFQRRLLLPGLVQDRGRAVREALQALELLGELRALAGTDGASVSIGDEIGRLATSFNRMRRSLETAMRMIDG